MLWSDLWSIRNKSHRPLNKFWASFFTSSDYTYSINVSYCALSFSHPVYKQLHMPNNRLELRTLYNDMLLLLTPDDYTFSQIYYIYKRMKRREFKEWTFKRLNKHITVYVRVSLLMYVMCHLMCMNETWNWTVRKQ